MMDLTTVARVRELADVSGSSLDTLISRIVTGISRQCELYLNREAELRARTEDCDVFETTSEIYTDAWPIVSVTSIANDSENIPRTYTDLLSSDDYLIYTGESGRGRIVFDELLDAGELALRVIYTGGMANGIDAGTLCSGADGVTGSGPLIDNQFDSVVGGFIINGVAPGDTLTITGGANAGTYIVESVVSATRLYVTTAFPAAPSVTEIWAITAIRTGLAYLYPDVVLAATMQAGYDLKRRDRLDVLSMSVGGQSVQSTALRSLDLDYYGASGLLPEVQRLLDPYRRRLYP